MSGEFDPNKRVRETLSPEMLAMQRARAEARKKQVKLETAPPAPRKEMVKATKQQVDFGGENPEEGMRVRTKITDEDRAAHRQLIEEGKKKEQEKKAAEIQSMMSEPITPSASVATAVPQRTSWFRRLFS